MSVNNTGIESRWKSPLHYNEGPLGSNVPVAGWNGFSTVAEFYNTFGVNSTPTKTIADSSLDSRIGWRYYDGCTNISGIRPGILVGQQYDSAGIKYMDRQGNLLIYDPNFSPDLKEKGPTLEDIGYRVVKYPPDYTGGPTFPNYSSGKAGNWCVIFRYPDVALMVAEAKMRSSEADNAGALALVNQLRATRKAAPLTSMTLVNSSNVYDSHTLLAERGRELYWESLRRTDLIRFGVFQKPWALKSASDATHLVFPVPTEALAANPNLKQNPGY